VKVKESDIHDYVYIYQIKASKYFNFFTLPTRREKSWISKKEIFAWTRLVGLVIVNED